MNSSHRLRLDKLWKIPDKNLTRGDFISPPPTLFYLQGLRQGHSFIKVVFVKLTISGSLGLSSFDSCRFLAANATVMENRDLINELKIMVTVGEHPNIVSLIGACTRGGKYCE